MEKNIQKIIDEGIQYYVEWLPGVYVVHTEKETADIMEKKWGTDIRTAHDIVPKWIVELNRKYKELIRPYNKNIDKYC